MSNRHAHTITEALDTLDDLQAEGADQLRSAIAIANDESKITADNEPGILLSLNRLIDHYRFSTPARRQRARAAQARYDAMQAS